MKEANEMDIKEMVDKINGMPTVLVKVNLGDTDKHDIVVADMDPTKLDTFLASFEEFDTFIPL